MAYIKLNQVGIDIPIYSSVSRSIKHKILNLATNEKLGEDKAGDFVVKALKNLNIEIIKGDRVGLIGQNGSGKSTLLRVLSGVYSPTFGDIRLEGSTASLIDLSLGIDVEATGRENIMLRGALLGVSKEKMQSSFSEIVEFSELNEFIEMPVKTYSSGMHLRLAFSVSTIIRPEILLMDEWLSVGDEKFNNKAAKRLNDLVNSTDILVIASHSKELIEKNCNRVIWLEDGKIKRDGNPHEVCSQYFS